MARTVARTAASRGTGRVRTATAAGFTLIELLVVVVILGLLAAVVVMNVGGLQDRGRHSACRFEAREFGTAQEAYNESSETGMGNGHYAAGATNDLQAQILHTAGLLQSSELGYSDVPAHAANHWDWTAAGGLDTSHCHI